ncbi:hypothetical protein [Bacteroides sp. 51]|uniref:hypothetical protein n=1 Tax=Bacteroides sp. 51 TaxID=2302938 RepID=UPI0013D8224E|nr:hypothetical protein [Bacteroides sp. 51]NDV81293.1 hypothetical protein [Bacteroides sp. 51]
MQVSELQVDQNATIEYWFRRIDGGDDCSIITGNVVRKLGDQIEIDVQHCYFGWFQGRNIWVRGNSEVIKINN